MELNGGNGGKTTVRSRGGVVGGGGGGAKVGKSLRGMCDCEGQVGGGQSRFTSATTTSLLFRAEGCDGDEKVMRSEGDENCGPVASMPTRYR